MNEVIVLVSSEDENAFSPKKKRRKYSRVHNEIAKKNHKLPNVCLEDENGQRGPQSCLIRSKNVLWLSHSKGHPVR